MPPGIIASLAEPLLLIATFAVGAFAGMTAEQFYSRMRRRAWRERNRWPSDKRREETSTASGPWSNRRDQPSPKQSDAADQLRTVMGADFTTQPVLNKGEARVFREVDRIVVALNPAWQVMAQVSLGEVLRCKDSKAYGCINSKRVDLLLMDDECVPRHAIEYQGKGHHRGTAAARDAVKKEALRRAGVGYHEVVEGHTTPAELRHLVEKLVDRPRAAAS
jgi:hypothetical protein